MEAFEEVSSDTSLAGSCPTLEDYIELVQLLQEPKKSVKKRCRSCNQQARSRSNYCSRHGGGLRCQVKNCTKGATTALGAETWLCTRHYKSEIAGVSLQKEPKRARVEHLNAVDLNLHLD
jgi:hypothetical protein